MPEFFFQRYVNGERMADDVLITKQATLEDAIPAALRLCWNSPKSVLVHIPQTPWRDIESAPKDGTEILGALFIDHKGGFGPIKSGPWTISWCECEWRPTWEKEFVLETESDFGATYKELDIQPTHWMPLPEPPR